MIDQFVSDIQCNAYTARIIRSPVSEGILRTIHVPPLPENCMVYTAKDLQYKRILTLFDAHIPVFAESEISYKGQAVGIVIGENPDIVAEIQKNITVEVDPLPGESFETESAHFFDYPIIAQKNCSKDNSDRIFETAQSVTYSSFTFASQHNLRSEMLEVVTELRESKVHIFLPTQHPMLVRRCAAKVTGIAEESIIVHPTMTGQVSNELLWYPALLAAQCAFAAVKSGHPVRLTLSYTESMDAAPKTPEVTIQYKSALSETHRLSAVNVFIIVKAGAFCPLISHILIQMASVALGMYEIPAYKIEAVALKTPDGLTDIFESWGEHFISNSLENHISAVTENNNFIPSEWRIDNTAAENKTVFSDLFETLIPKSDFLRKNAAYRLFNTVRKERHDGKLRGIGLAAGFEYTGCPLAAEYTVEVCLNTDHTISVKTAAMNEYVKNITEKLISDKLEIEENNITFSQITSEEIDHSSPYIKSYINAVVPPIIEQCIADIQEQRFREPLPLSIRRSYAIPSPLDTAEKTNEQCIPFLSKTPAACIIELELDPVCYETSILGVWFSCNPGTIYRRKQANSIIHKNIVTALSRTVKESFLSNRHSNGSGVPPEYAMMLPVEIPESSIQIIQNKQSMSNTGSFGVTNLFSAAYLAALNQIFISAPLRIEKIPVLPHDMFGTLTGQVNL